MSVESLGDFLKKKTEKPVLYYAQVSFQLASKIKEKLAIDVSVIIRSKTEELIFETKNIYEADLLRLKARRVVMPILRAEFPDLATYKIKVKTVSY